MGASCYTNSKLYNKQASVHVNYTPKNIAQNIEYLPQKITKQQFFELENVLEQSYIQNNQYDKFWEFILQQEQNQEKQQKTYKFYNQFAITYALLYGIVFIIKNNQQQIIGASFFFPPGQIEKGQLYTKSRICNTQWVMYKEYDCKVNININKIVKLKIEEYNNLTQQKHKQYATQPHWYLQNISILPKYQNMGYASQFVNLLKFFIDRDNVLGYLECNGQYNRIFFNKHGFKTIDKLIVNIEDKPELGVLNNDGGTTVMIINPYLENDTECNTTGLMSKEDIIRI